MPDPSVHWSVSDLLVTSHGANEIVGCYRYGFPVTPESVRENLSHLAALVLDPLADVFGWKINSCYRSPTVNALVGGSPNSAHTIGLACDGHPADGRGSFAEVITWLAAHPELPLDRVIYEVRGASRWLHVQASVPRRSVAPPLYFLSASPLRFLPTSAPQLAELIARAS